VDFLGPRDDTLVVTKRPMSHKEFCLLDLESGSSVL
jgi:hypothetical protein